MKGLILGAAAAFGAGIWLAGLHAWSMTALYITATALALAAAWTIMKYPRYAAYPILALFLLAGMIRFLQAEALSPSDISRLDGQTATVSGIVREPPVITALDQQRKKVRYAIDVDAVVFPAAGDVVSTGGIIVTALQGADKPVAGYGSRIMATGKVSLISSYKNPGAADFAKIQKLKGISARMYVPDGNIKVLQDGQEGSLAAFLAERRARLFAKINESLGPHHGPLLNGMLFGGYNGIEAQVAKDFAATGLVHILSVSGAHIALVAGVIFWLGGRLRLRRPLSAWLAAVSIYAYAVFSGFTPPVIRSVIMGMIAIAAIIIGREKDTPVALALAVLGMLAYQPGYLYDISFELSVGATAGLVFLYAGTAGTLSRFLPRWLAEAWAVTLAAQIGVLPFLGWYFSAFSLSSFLANVFILPIIELAVIIGLAASAAFFFLPAGSEWFFALCGFLVDRTVILTALLASLPGGVIYLPSFNIAGGLAFYLGTAWLYGYVPAGVPSLAELWRRRPVMTGLGSMVLIFGLTAYWLYPGKTEVHFIDVGQGDATLIITPHRRGVLIDAGGSPGDAGGFDIGERVVVPYLKHQGITELDYLILTHGHADHAGGAAAVARALPVQAVLIAREMQSAALKPVLQAVREQGGAIIPAYNDQMIHVDGVAFKVVHAAAGAAGRPGNETSSVIRVSYGRHSFLITGDLDVKGEANVLAKGIESCTVLKVGHHGAETSTSPEFLAAVSPFYAVVSAGYNNKYGHPHPATLRRLEERKVDLYRTDRDGAVIFSTNGREIGLSVYSR